MNSSYLFFNEEFGIFDQYNNDPKVFQVCCKLGPLDWDKTEIDGRIQKIDNIHEIKDMIVSDDNSKYEGEWNI